MRWERKINLVRWATFAAPHARPMCFNEELGGSNTAKTELWHYNTFRFASSSSDTPIEKHLAL